MKKENLDTTHKPFSEIHIPGRKQKKPEILKTVKKQKYKRNSQT